MINGAHANLYSDDADATRSALAKVLGTRSVDAGGGWLIFALPPAELAVHPAEEGGRAELYLMTDDVAATVAALQAEGIEVARPISDQGWGLLTAITLPGGVELGSSTRLRSRSASRSSSRDGRPWARSAATTRRSSTTKNRSCCTQACKASSGRVPSARPSTKGDRPWPPRGPGWPQRGGR